MALLASTEGQKDCLFLSFGPQVGCAQTTAVARAGDSVLRMRGTLRVSRMTIRSSGAGHQFNAQVPLPVRFPRSPLQLSTTQEKVSRPLPRVQYPGSTMNRTALNTGKWA